MALGKQTDHAQNAERSLPVSGAKRRQYQPVRPHQKTFHALLRPLLRQDWAVYAALHPAFSLAFARRVTPESTGVYRSLPDLMAQRWAKKPVSSFLVVVQPAASSPTPDTSPFLSDLKNRAIPPRFGTLSLHVSGAGKPLLGCVRLLYEHRHHVRHHHRALLRCHRQQYRHNASD